MNSLSKSGLLEKAAEAGLRSIFVGLETLDEANLRQCKKLQNVNRDYSAAIRRVYDNGVMVNGSFVFGMDSDGPDVFDRTLDWAIGNGVETSTFHVMTPYPGTGLFQRIEAEGRLLHRDWDRYDTRQAVFNPANMTTTELEAGYWRAYKEFYTWRNIWRGASAKDELRGRLRHMAYAGGWKKFEGLWNFLIRSRQVAYALPVLESVLAGFGNLRNRTAPAGATTVPSSARPIERESVLVGGVVARDQEPGLSSGAGV